MKPKTLIAIGTLWIASLVGVGLWAQASRKMAPLPTPHKPLGDIITGENIGFQRVELPPRKDGSVVGWWMIKIDGEWRATAQPIR
jgi:hypothetical protein